MRPLRQSTNQDLKKNALFTPQMFDTLERRVLAEAVERKGESAFTFVDIGATSEIFDVEAGQMSRRG